MPFWLHSLAVASIVLGCLSSVAIAIDLLCHPQRMWIMNLVWPLCALFGGPGLVWYYFHYGRNDGKHTAQASTAISVANGTLHCGSGCTLGDIAAEALLLLFPAIATWFGWHSLYEDRIFAAWIIDYIFAFGFGVIFQYFTIAPMRKLQFLEGLRAAIKADALSLTAWQLGMFGFMAIAHFYWFPRLLHLTLQADTPEFWFMMQIAMICGFASSYPMNWWLIGRGLKERM